MNLISTLARFGRSARGRRTGRPGRPGRAGSRQRPREGDVDDERASGCGWFDSSWTLRQGLQVIELPAQPPVRPCEAPADAHERR
jgi:hypothetical protein